VIPPGLNVCHDSSRSGHGARIVFRIQYRACEMPKFRFVFRPVKYLSERRLRSRRWRLSTRIVEHLDIRFDRWRTLRHFVRRDTLSHLGSCSFSELRLLDVPPALQIVDKCRNCLDISRHHPRHDLLFLIKVSDLRRSLSASLWSVGCLDLVSADVTDGRKRVRLRAYYVAGSPGKGAPHVGA
jgi:hypothetical protein